VDDLGVRYPPHLSDAFTTGSSMLPQKKNSDVAELARGKAGRLVGNLAALLVDFFKGLPLSYNRDLQEDKEPLFDSVSSGPSGCSLPDRRVRLITFASDVMSEAAGDPLIAAIDLAEWLVERGTPFRDAHELLRPVGRRKRSTPCSGHRCGEQGLRGDPRTVRTWRRSRARRSPGAAGPLATRCPGAATSLPRAKRRRSV
jgi:hypothetical protein